MSGELDAEIVVRGAGAADRPAVLALLADSLGWARDATFAEFFDWKPRQNPFGPSPASIALAGDDIVGFRTFALAVRTSQRTHPPCRARHRYRNRARLPGAGDLPAVDDDRGRSVHRRRCRLRVQHPDATARPGYLRMGWTTVGRVPLVVRVAGVADTRCGCGRRRWRPNVGRSKPARDRRRHAPRRRPCRGPARRAWPAPKVAHHENNRVSPLAVRAAGARLPGDRHRRQPVAWPGRVPAASPGPGHRGRRVGRARTGRRRPGRTSTTPCRRARHGRRLRRPCRRNRTGRAPRRIHPIPPPRSAAHLAAARGLLAAAAAADLDLVLGDVELL